MYLLTRITAASWGISWRGNGHTQRDSTDINNVGARSG
ncbi:hypothetical protein KUC_3809 [Vreelandella boliviensis LC1]|uniref:Uncharacterized protein n=1 Tax=Vreelandella boliviensis LC1 TaxID=1072583 RepID=A0A7U9BY36_9GAMM|nr:hypothetical protein KUC_3809 [Halomonas boliviensis LC1]